MKRSMFGALVALVFAVGMIVAVTSTTAGADGSRLNLNDLRHATAKFHSLKNTMASGRVDLHLCVDHMGQHFADPQTFSDGILDPLNPEAMVYSQNAKGQLRLVAVEWVSATPGMVMNIPLHFNPAVNLWVLHAWLYSQNPNGMFADMNPRIGVCPPA
jgi:hypothetical protein